MGMHPNDQRGPRRVSEEVFELSADSIEMLFQAMELLKEVRTEYCSADTYENIKTLQQAFAIYKLTN